MLWTNCMDIWNPGSTRKRRNVLMEIDREAEFLCWPASFEKERTHKWEATPRLKNSKPNVEIPVSGGYWVSICVAGNTNVICRKTLLKNQISDGYPKETKSFHTVKTTENGCSHGCCSCRSVRCQRVKAAKQENYDKLVVLMKWISTEHVHYLIHVVSDR